MRKHRVKYDYDKMEPAAKKRFLKNNQIRYSKMSNKKKRINSQTKKEASINQSY